MSYTVGSFFLRKRFFPLFLVQFAGAFNDNLLKQALGLFIIYSADSFNRGYLFEYGPLLLIVANVLFTLPFFLFSALAGQLADKFEKSLLIRLIKYLELFIMILAAIGFIFMQLELLLVVLCLMGLQSTLFGPIKYSILPDHLAQDELVGGNALIEGGTFISILLGTLIAGLIVQSSMATSLVSLLLIMVAALGVLASWRVPKAPVSAADLKIDLNILRSTWDIMRYAADIKPVFLSIVGISWFWVLGALFVTLFAPFAKDDLGANQEVVSSFLAMFSIGIALGSWLCSRALHGDISARYLPVAALGISFFSWDLSYFSYVHGPFNTPHSEYLLGFWDFLQTAGSWRIFLDMVLIAVSGGFFVVPLYAIMQSKSDEVHRARVIASNNVVNALAIVVGSLFVLFLQQIGVTTPGIFAIFGVINLVIAWVVSESTPKEVAELVLRGLLKRVFRVEVRGLQELSATSGPCLFVANHTSRLDELLLCLFLPSIDVLCIDKGAASSKLTRFISFFVKTFTVDQANPFSIKPLVKRLRSGENCVIFPEGRVSVTGSLMKVYETPVFLSDKAGVPIVPIYIEGAGYSIFSLLKGKVRRKWFPKITLTVLPAAQIAEGTQERSDGARWLYDVMSAAAVSGAKEARSIFGTLCEAARLHGGNRVILEDHTRQVLTYSQVLTRSVVLARVLDRKLKHQQVVGLLLPNSNGTALTVFGLSYVGLVPAMLNLSAGLKHVDACCRAAGVTHILSSRVLLADENLGHLLEQLADSYSLLYLEDLRAEISVVDKFLGVVNSKCAVYLGSLREKSCCGDDTAVVLFTSGSEGWPKGVALSHRALVTNTRQVLSRVDCGPQDRVFNALPMFHSFGLSVGVFLPLFAGMKCFLYPSPLHFKAIAELVYDTGATMLFGTDTFLRGYARVAHPYDFYTLKYVFAGAEKLSEATRSLWFERFGVRILEGYGATETAPVLSLNTPMFFRSGSVGRLLPGIEYRLRPFEGVGEGGVLEVRGPNVMNGYYKEDRPAELEPVEDGWYDTGDVVKVDDEGYLFILGRVKRFAKVAGEMVSLTTVERIIEGNLPGFKSALVIRRHAQRGEELVLFTEKPKLTRAECVAFVKAAGFSAAWSPRAIVHLVELPLLPSGKVDYVTLAELLKAPENTAQGEVVNES